MTAAELIASALRKLSLIGDFESPTAEQVSQHIHTLNDAMAQFEAEGLDVGYSAVESGTEEIYVPPFAMNFVKLALLIALAGEYDKPLAPEQVALYSEARRVLVLNLTKPQPVSQLGNVPRGDVWRPFRIDTR